MPTRASGDVPPDPIHEPHDVLAAEEFAMPAGGLGRISGGGLEPRTFIPGLALAGALYGLIRLLRR